jgi:hypothetical protein
MSQVRIAVLDPIALRLLLHELMRVMQSEHYGEVGLWIDNDGLKVKVGGSWSPAIGRIVERER